MTKQGKKQKSVILPRKHLRVNHVGDVSREVRNMLRQRFEAESDIIVTPAGDWKAYGKWLEGLAAEEINKELVKSTLHLLGAVRAAIKILDKGISQA